MWNSEALKRLELSWLVATEGDETAGDDAKMKLLVGCAVDERDKSLAKTDSFSRKAFKAVSTRGEEGPLWVCIVASHLRLA